MGRERSVVNYQQYFKNYYQNHKAEMKSVIVQKTRQRNLKRKKVIVDHYTNNTNICACCGLRFDNLHFLTVDHINNDGKKYRETMKKVGKSIGGIGFYSWIVKNNFPKDLQILCWNCNMAKSHNGGICPHQKSLNG